jgi:hypothetical protein
VADRGRHARSLTYDPDADVAARFPDWIVASVDLGGVIPEVLSPARRVILLERTLDRAARRSSLAHAVAHLDLGHHRTLAGWFENREEAAADELAARRLIPIDDLGRVLAWTDDRVEAAAELDVDLAMLAVRERRLAPPERRRLRAVIRRPSCAG